MSTLEYFWHLSATNKTTRLDASEQLVGALEKFQAAHEVSTPATTTDATEGLDQRNAPDVAYAIKRLVRGLASPRESSRLGFSVALTELLSRLETVTAAQMIQLILDASESSNSMKGQEQRDMLFARLFGLTALAQSNLLVHPTLSSEQDIQRVLDALVALGAKRSWLRESAAWAAVRIFAALHKAEGVAWRDKAAKHLVAHVLENEREWTQEKVALVLVTRVWFPELKWKKLLAPTFGDASILAPSNLATLAKILKEGELGEEDAPAKATNAVAWQPQLHFVWDVIADQLIPKEDAEPQAEVAAVQDFFRIVVDENLFAATASTGRKYSGFLIFQKLASRVLPSDLPLLLTRNFMRTWINHLSKADRWLHKIAKQVAQDVQKIVTNEPRAGLSLVLQLLGQNGNRQFDQITRTKTVESILSSMSPSGIQEYANYLFEQVGTSHADSDSEASSSQAKQLWVIDQLSALVRNPAVPKDDACTKDILDFLVLHGFFTVEKKSSKSKIAALRFVPQPPFDEELQKECRARLLASLADLLTHTVNKKAPAANGELASTTASRQPGYALDGELWLVKVWKTYAELEGTKHVSLAREPSDVESELRTKITAALVTLSQAPQETKDQAAGVELLLTGGILQVFADVDAGTAEELEDCAVAVSRMFVPPSHSKSKSKVKDKKDKGKTKESSAPTIDGDAEQPEPIDVFVDFLVGCLERGTAYSRTIATKAFEPLCGALTGSGVKFIMDQLERRPVTMAQAEEGEDEDEDIAMDGEEANGTAHSHSDEESAGGSGSESEENDDEDSEKDSDGEEEDEEYDDAGDAELRVRLEEALRLSGIQPAGEDEDEEELMNDDQMMQFDEQLAAVFRTRKAEKGGAKQNLNAQREATHFKNRVLDLVDIYLRKQATSQHVVNIVLPLLELVTGTSQDEKQLQEKTTGIIRTRFGKSKELPHLKDTSEAQTVFTELHNRARRGRSAQVVGIIGQCALYLARTLVQAGESELVSQLYGESLKDYATRKSSSLTTAFFEEFVRRLPTQAFGTREALLAALEKPHNFYRGTQLFHIFQIMASQLTPEQLHKSGPSMWPSFRDVLYSTISSACDADSAPKAAHLRDALKVGYACMRISKRSDTSPEAFQKLWDAPRLSKLVEAVATNERFKSAGAVQTSMKQMRLFVSPALDSQKSKPKSTGAKRSAPEPEIEDKPQRKKVRKSKD